MGCPPCDSTGRPCFSSGKTAHFTGGRGIGGDLFAEDPAEGSVWVYGQKNYFTNQSNKMYLQFCNGKFHPLAEDEILSALQSAPQISSDDLRRDQLIRIMFDELCAAKQNHILDILKKHGISPEELAAYGINI